VVDCLLDTSVLVDVLRKHPPALDWLSVQSQPGVTPVVWMELIEGARDRVAQRRALKLLRDFERVDLTPADFDWAIQRLIRFQLSHNVGMNDCLIAAASFRLHVPLHTANLKHFTPLLGRWLSNPTDRAARLPSASAPYAPPDHPP
jgi:predicted nucleic acid-binding protein